jgi:hypothetical protein
MTRRPLLAVALLTAVFAAGLAVRAPAADDEGWIKLFNGKDLTGWKIYLDPKANADPNQIIQVKDGEIAVEGSVMGYLRTEKDYGDFVLRLQWRWGEKLPKRPNSGVFVWVTGDDKIWPKAVEAQLASGQAGDIWLVDGFKLQVDPSRQDKRNKRHYYRVKTDKPVEKPLGEWNQYEITCKGGTIKLVINGQEVNEGTDAEITSGHILLQSEGAPIYFRNVELKPIK